MVLVDPPELLQGSDPHRITYLDQIPIEVPWGLFLLLVGGALIASWMGALHILREIREVDPNKVLRDNGMP